MKNCSLILKVTLIINFQLLFFNCFAQTDTLEIHTINGKEYYIHVIAQGESLYYLHKKFNVPIEVLKKENPSVLDGLSIGEKVFVPIKKDIEFEVKTDGNYLNHTVKKKQTLYAISKLYNVEQKAIVAANPEISDGLKEDQEIRIPVFSIKKEEAPKVSIEKKKYATHTIKKGETYYSLTKLYSTTVDSIKLVNGGLKQGLKAGETIYIPKQQQTDLLITSTTLTDTLIRELALDSMFENLVIDTGIVTRKKEYVIGLFLPFYLDVNDEIVENRKAFDKKNIYPKSKFALEFYNGVVMALNAISTDSCKFKLQVFDTDGDDSLRTSNLLSKPEIQTFDLIIGPLYPKNFKQVATFANQHQIPIVSPVKQSNKTLLGNQMIFKAIPSKSTTLKELTKMVVDSFKTENLIAISHVESIEKSLVESYIKSYNDLILGTEDTTLYSTIKKLDINTDINVVVNSLHPTKNNILFVPSTHQTFVTNLVGNLATVLSKKNYENYRVTVIGLEEWMGYGNIDLLYYQKLNLHYCTARFIEDKDSLTHNFIERYVAQTSTYPTKNSFLGYDIINYFGSNFLNYGTLFSSLSLSEYKGLSIRFNFFKTGVESGFENTKSYCIKFDDFTLKKVE